MKKTLPFPSHPRLLAVAMAVIATSSAQAADDQTLTTVTVSANKIEQDAQSIPQSITVISESELQEKGITKVADVVGEIPNMFVNGAGGNGMGVSFRGLNTSIFTNNNPVVVYIDGIPYSNRYGFDPSLANVERVEVLRGPQGSIYGKDAIGAVISIVTKKPSDTWHGSVGLELSSNDTRYSSFNAAGALLKEQLYAGINGQYDSSEGWIENTWPGMEKKADADRTGKLGGYLLWTPHADLDAKLTLSRDRRTGHWYKNTQALAGGTSLSEFRRSDAEKASYDTRTRETGDTDAQSLALTWRLDGVTLDAVTTHKTFTMKGIYDADFGTSPLYTGLSQFNNSRTETWSQELRLSSSAKTGLRWVAGLYLEKEKHEQGPYGMQFPNFDPSTMDYLGSFGMDAHSLTDSKTQALFGQLIYPIGAAELTLGGRWQQLEKKFDIDTYYLPVGLSGPAMYSMADTNRASTFLPKAALSYPLHKNWTAYVSYAKGYMPGGYNYFSSGGSTADNRFEPQISDNYEIGIKGQAGNVTLAANLFHMNIEDIHIYKAQGALYTTGNAKKAHSTGAELEVGWQPARHWELSGALGLISAKYDDYDTGSHNFDGETIANTPSHTLRLSAAYLAPSGAYGRVDVRNQGRVMFYDDALKSFVREKGHTTVDIKAGYRFADWDLYAFVHNLTDTKYINGFMSSSSITMASFGEPRRIGIGARYHF